MRFRDFSSLIVLLVIGIFFISRLGEIGKIIGFLFVAAGIVFLILFLKGEGVLKKHQKKSEEQEDEIDERDAEIIRQAEEIEKLEKYDIDSGLEYCAHCGNYSVKEGRCEVCGEKVTE